MRFWRPTPSFHKALELAPEDYDATLWRGFALYRQENYQKAADILFRLRTEIARRLAAGILSRSRARGPPRPEHSVDGDRARPRREEESDAECLPVFLYLVDTAPEMPPELLAEGPAARRSIPPGIESRGRNDHAVSR